jgi:hypothetical protein
VGTRYLGSEPDYILQSGIPELYFSGGYYEADLGNYSQYDRPERLKIEKKFA